MTLSSQIDGGISTEDTTRGLVSSSGDPNHFRVEWDYTPQLWFIPNGEGSKADLAVYLPGGFSSVPEKASTLYQLINDQFKTDFSASEGKMLSLHGMRLALSSAGKTALETVFGSDHSWWPFMITKMQVDIRVKGGRRRTEVLDPTEAQSQAAFTKRAAKLGGVCLSATASGSHSQLRG